MESCAEFVAEFHADLTRWFSGEGDRQTVWESLSRATPDDMVLVYPSGTSLSGAEFLRSIAERFGSSPGFVASVSDVRTIAEAPGHVAVAYVEEQSGAQQSVSINRRSALAIVNRHDDGWTWRYIQETAI